VKICATLVGGSCKCDLVIHTFHSEIYPSEKERPPATPPRQADTIMTCCSLPQLESSVFLLWSFSFSSFFTIVYKRRFAMKKAGYYFLKEHGIKKSTQDKRTEKKRHTNLAIYRRAIDGMRFTVSQRLGSLRSCRGSTEVVEDGAD